VTDNLPNGGLSRIKDIRDHLNTLHRQYLLWRDPLTTDRMHLGHDVIGAAYAAIRELDQLVDEIKAAMQENPDR